MITSIATQSKNVKSKQLNLGFCSLLQSYIFSEPLDWQLF